MKRNIIKIDEEKCNGCGKCVTGCPEGAIQMINGKARLVSENYCDGLGACIGNCPVDAITIEEREAAPYSEALVIETMIKQGDDMVKVHLKHLLEHNETGLYNEAIEILRSKGKSPEPVIVNHGHSHGHSCPASMNRILVKKTESRAPESGGNVFSRLNQWPVKLKLISPSASLFSGEIDLLVSADCAPFASGNFHDEFLNGRIMVTFCPKLDPYIEEYREKLAEIMTNSNIKSVTIARMEVPCCGGVTSLVREAVKRSEKDITVDERIVRIT